MKYPTIKACTESSGRRRHHKIMATERDYHELQGRSYSIIPEEIAAEILSHLPVKSLLKLRSVCKSWLHIIDSPYFITNLHLLRSKNKSPVFIFKMLASFQLEKTRTWKFAFFLSENELPHHNRALVQEPAIGIRSDYHYNTPPPEILTSCDGLLALAFFAGGKLLSPSIYIANPSTRQTLSLPLNHHDKDMIAQETNFIDHVSAKILFDPNSQSYKLLFVWRREYRLTRHECHEFGSASVFTIGSNHMSSSNDPIWRRITSPLIKNWVMLPKEYSFGTIMKGAFHFLVRDFTKQLSTSIVAFDIHCESFRSIPKPKCCYNCTTKHARRRHIYLDPSYHISLMTIEGHLYLFHFNNLATSFEVWVLEDYEKGVWIKTHKLDRKLPRLIGIFGSSSTIPYSYSIPSIHDRSLVFFKGLRDEESIEVYYFDPKSQDNNNLLVNIKKKDMININDDQKSFWKYALNWAWALKPYVESLVPIMYCFRGIY